MRSTTAWIAFLILAVIGLADAGYLSYMALSAQSLSCGIVEGCNAVAQSSYSRVFGVPLALYGAVFYAIVILLVLASRTLPPRAARTLLIAVTGAGFLSSAYFVYVQLFTIEAVCIYCLLSAFVATLLFLLSFSVPISRRDAGSGGTA